jgi:hypothetical protein
LIPSLNKPQITPVFTGALVRDLRASRDEPSGRPSLSGKVAATLPGTGAAFVRQRGRF